MRFYPEADINFYIDIPDGWDRNCRRPNKSWKIKPLPPTKLANYWRDLEGAKKSEILESDLYFKKWMTSRINKHVCLPLLYSNGRRFIKITMAFPADFNCAPSPLSLAEAAILKQKLLKERKARNQGKKAARLAKKAKMIEAKEEKEAQRLATLRSKWVTLVRGPPPKSAVCECECPDYNGFVCPSDESPYQCFG